MERRLRIRVRGASPYGFRLVGGGGKPVSVTKLRARSKAAEAGLLEGDEILAVNGYSCRDVSYERLIGLVEHAGHYIDLDVVRRAQQPPGAGSRDRKWSHDRFDDVITSPTPFDRHRHLSSPTLDYDNVFDKLDADAIFSTFVFDEEPARQPLVERPTTTARKPWQEKRVRSDDSVSVVWNPDKSITMSLALQDDAGSKENRPPAQHPQQQRHRNESFLMMSSPASARVISPSPSRSLTHQMWTPRPISPPLQHRERTAADLWLSRPTPPMPTSTNVSKFGPLPPDVLKIITPPSDAESLDSLSPTHLSKRKKYADSSFYDSKSHDYPTVEEQIKMARQMAQSLTAPANQATRGHRMFMKRKEKSVNWAVDDTNRRRRPSLDLVSEDLYYNPTPRKATASWKPKPSDLRSVSMSPIPRLFAPHVPPASEEKAKYMSAEEFERMRLFEDKTTHDTVAPQLCFNLAADLRQSASKGGRMFAKRRAKADQWTVGNDLLPNVQATKPIRSYGFVPAARSSQEPDYDEVTSELPRAAMSPWEAVEQFGHVEPAFEHLHHSTTPSSSIPHQSTPQYQQSKRGAVSAGLSSTHNHLTSPINGSNYSTADDDDDDVIRLTSQIHQQPFSNATSPWQRDVSTTPSSVSGSYRPIHFKIN